MGDQQAQMDFDTADAVLRTAMSKGAEFAEIFYETVRSQAISLDNQLVDEITSLNERGAGVRAVSGDSTGYAYTNSMDVNGLLEAAEAAAASARSSGGSIAMNKPDVQVDGGRSPEIDPFETPIEDQIKSLRTADEAARSRDPSVMQVTGHLAYSHQEVVIANSEGLFVRDSRNRCRFVVLAVAGDGSDFQRGAESAAATSGLELLRKRSVSEVAIDAADQAIVKLKAIPCPAGQMPVVLGSRAAGVLFHEACGHPCEADGIVKRTSVYADLMGKRVASDFVTIVDDATFEDAWGTFAFDDEGTPAQRTLIVDKGMLTEYLSDRANGAKLGMKSTGNGRRQSFEHVPIPRMTNTFLLPGDQDAVDIIKDTPKGIWIGRLAGGQVNPVNGDFVFGAQEAYLIENGELTKPLRGATLIGDGPTTLGRIDAVASDFDMQPGTCGKAGQFAHAGCGQPTLRVSMMTIGGTG